MRYEDVESLLERPDYVQRAKPLLESWNPEQELNDNSLILWYRGHLLSHFVEVAIGQREDGQRAVAADGALQKGNLFLAGDELQHLKPRRILVLHKVKYERMNFE